MKVFFGFAYHNPIEYATAVGVSPTLSNWLVNYGLEYSLSNYISVFFESGIAFIYGFPDSDTVSRRIIPILIGTRYNFTPRVNVCPFIGFATGGYLLKRDGIEMFSPAFVSELGLSAYFLGFLFSELQIRYALYRYSDRSANENYNSLSIAIKMGIFL